MNTAVATIPQRQSLVQKFAAKYSIEPDKLMSILKATAFKVKDGEVTNEQMAALLVVADQYGLNPFTREIFAFPDKNGIVPVVGVDGWSRIINDHPQSDGFEFQEAEKMVELPDAKRCPEWMEVVIYRKDRSHPIVVREYLDEVYRPRATYPDGNKKKEGPWQTHTKRFLRHKVLIQGARIAYGFGGIYDEDEAIRITEREINPMPEPSAPSSRSATARLASAVGADKVSETVIEPTQPPKITLQAAVAALGDYNSEETIGLYADDLPDAIRASDEFSKGVAKRMAEIKASKAAEHPETEPGGKRAGTPKLRKQYVAKIAEIGDLDVLAVAYDETRSFIWGKEDQDALAAAYNDRQKTLSQS